MSRRDPNPAKELYERLRRETWERLWNEEVPAFNRATPGERAQCVGLIRAVGVVFVESGPAEASDEVRSWLRSLLADPDERIRRYALNALPKLGAGEEEEELMLGLLQGSENDREKKFVAGALEKIGGERTARIVGGRMPQTEQKTRAAEARSVNPGRIVMDNVLTDIAGLRIHLRGRRGLEGIVRGEVEAAAAGPFRVVEMSAGLVVIEPSAPFCLADLFRLRCFGTAGFWLGTCSGGPGDLASLVVSQTACRIMETFTDGPVRYRLDFVSKGHQRGAVREIANRAYALCPGILNDARMALWAADIHPTESGESLELRPRWSPDPRFAYRRRDVPAASHPSLAASMAWLAGQTTGETVWDPFCGSGVELVERALLGGVSRIFGTDLSAEAIAIARENFSASGAGPVELDFHCGDFRDWAKVRGLLPGSVGLIITNPPMGQRVPVPDLRSLISDLLEVAAVVLRPGGRLIFANPIRAGISHPQLRRTLRQTVDMGGFDCRLEVYVKAGGKTGGHNS